MPSNTPEESRSVALRANIAAYEKFDERKYINGAPHLKHASIGRLYRSLIDKALGDLGGSPAEVEVLELGAGNGLASGPWFEHKVRLTAVDSSQPMLEDLARKAERYGIKPACVVADADAYLASNSQQFDIVTHVSMLHHVPDYLHLLTLSTAHVRPGGSLITFQDPLKHESVPWHHHALDRASYFAWRAFQGNYGRGVKTRWRRMRGVYSPAEVVDFDEYHEVRKGVDSEAIAALLRGSFAKVEVVTYWTTYARILQRLGERLQLRSGFGILASGRR